MARGSGLEVSRRIIAGSSPVRQRAATRGPLTRPRRGPNGGPNKREEGGGAVPGPTSVTVSQDFRSPASVLAPASVALVGASERGQWQGLIYRNLRDFKYPGRVFLVNPRQQ